MKKFTMFSNYLFLLMAAAVLGLTACGDEIMLDTEIPPSVRIDGDAEVIPGGIITLTIRGSKGSGGMNLLTITENGTTIDFSRITSSDIGGNPASLIDHASAFVFTVEIDGPTIPGDYTYAATVDAVDGETNIPVRAEVTVKSTPMIEYVGTNPRAVGLGGKNYAITATPLGADLAKIAVYNDGELMNFADLAFNGVDFDDNPYYLVGDDVSGFELADVLVRITEADNYILTFEVEDAFGETAKTKEIMVAAGTPIPDGYTASLSNADGPSGPTEPFPVFGGLDLDTGENVPVNSSEADIIDLGLSVTTGEWRRQIQGVNGITLRAASGPELLNFDNINFRETIIAAFDDGADVNPSEMVEEGNIFIANRGDDYFIMRVTDLDPSPDDNRDAYMFDIKTSIQ